jgi:hypothetical protein
MVLIFFILYVQGNWYLQYDLRTVQYIVVQYLFLCREVD